MMEFLLLAGNRCRETGNLFRVVIIRTRILNLQLFYQYHVANDFVLKPSAVLVGCVYFCTYDFINAIAALIRNTIDILYMLLSSQPIGLTKL